jgi:hypothetical protein
MIVIEFSKDEIGFLRGAIDLAIRQGGTQVARQLLPLDQKIFDTYEAWEKTQQLPTAPGNGQGEVRGQRR